MRNLTPAILLMLLFGCTPPKEKAPVVKEQIDQYFSQQFPDNEPGGAVLIAKDDSVIFSKGYGLADIRTKERITTNTLFNLGSISKTFVANAILILQEQHKLSTEDSIIRYFPEFSNSAIGSKVKIRHLLTHTAGLPDNRRIKRDSVFYLTAKDAENWFPVSQTDSLLFEPGTHYEYSNPAFNALALIVEQVSHKKWQLFVEEKIMRPSGMQTSTITDGSHPETGVSHGYIKVRGKWHEKDYGEEPTFAAAGNGGVWSSVKELQFYEVALHKALWLKYGTIQQSRTVQRPPNWADKKPPFIGWSWFIGTTRDGQKTVGHKGTQGGFIANYVVIPAKGIHIFILCNSPRDVEEMTETVIRLLSSGSL